MLLAAMLALGCAGCAVGETGGAGNVTDTGATVGGRVVSTVGGGVEYWVEYGPTRAYGGETAHATITTQPHAPQSVVVEISGLARATRYHYRLCASDAQQSGGAGCGADRTLRTQSFACGDTVRASVRLTGYVDCTSTGIGLVVGADGIDINLAGYGLGLSVLAPSASIDNRGGYDDVTIRNGGLGGSILLEGASRNLIRDVAVTANTYAVQIAGGEGNEIRASTLSGARTSAVSTVASTGLAVADSHLTSGAASAIRVQGDRARIARNEVPQSSGGLFSGIELTGSDGRIVDNHVTGPTWTGGIVVVAGANNVVAENDVSDVTLPRGHFGASDGDGIFVGPFTAGTLLRNNLVDRNEGDGIELQAPDARLRGNGARDNGDFGIDAAPGVTDLGGNFASGNGNPLQCRNVFCS